MATSVLVIHNEYQQAGGERAAVKAQIDLLRSRGHPLAVYGRDSAEIQRYRLGDKVAFFPRAVFSWRTYREIQAAVRRARPDVAHVHNVFPLISPSAYLALRDAGVPIVQSVHNFRFLCPNGLFYRDSRPCELCRLGNTLHAARHRCFRQSYLLSALYALSIGLHRQAGTFHLIDRFLALTGFAARKLVESGLAPEDRVAVVGNYLPEPLPVPGSRPSAARYVVYVGRLSSEKGVETLVDAVAGLQDVGLKVLGDGYLLLALRARATEKGLHSVEFLGYQTGEAKWQAIRGALALVLPSVCYENFPLAVLEGMAAGIPVIASRLGSLPYVVQEGATGLLFDPGDAAALRAQIAWVVEHGAEAHALAERARRKVEESYSEAAHYEALLKVYSEVRK